MTHEQWIIQHLFKLSDEPLVLRDWLRINKMYQEGLSLEGKLPGVRLRRGKSYLFFIIAWNVILLPLSAIFHQLLSKIDCHLLILMAILLTGLFIISYTLFKESLLDAITLQKLKQGWENHFPLFDYATHAPEVARIYTQALDKEIPHKNMHLYILDRLVA